MSFRVETPLHSLFRLKMGLDPKFHPFLLSRDAACLTELLQHVAFTFGVNQHLQLPATRFHFWSCLRGSVTMQEATFASVPTNPSHGTFFHCTDPAVCKRTSRCSGEPRAPEEDGIRQQVSQLRPTAAGCVSSCSCTICRCSTGCRERPGAAVGMSPVQSDLFQRGFLQPEFCSK